MYSASYLPTLSTANNIDSTWASCVWAITSLNHFEGQQNMQSHSISKENSLPLRERSLGLWNANRNILTGLCCNDWYCSSLAFGLQVQWSKNGCSIWYRIWNKLIFDANIISSFLHALLGCWFFNLLRKWT